jgi:hypothetical protein
MIYHSLYSTHLQFQSAAHQRLPLQRSFKCFFLGTFKDCLYIKERMAPWRRHRFASKIKISWMSEGLWFILLIDVQRPLIHGMTSGYLCEITFIFSSFKETTLYIKEIIMTRAFICAAPRIKINIWKWRVMSYPPVLLFFGPLIPQHTKGYLLRDRTTSFPVTFKGLPIHLKRWRMTLEAFHLRYSSQISSQLTKLLDLTHHSSMWVWWVTCTTPPFSVMGWDICNSWMWHMGAFFQIWYRIFWAIWLYNLFNLYRDYYWPSSDFSSWVRYRGGELVPTPTIRRWYQKILNVTRRHFGRKVYVKGGLQWLSWKGSCF